MLPPTWAWAVCASGLAMALAQPCRLLHPGITGSMWPTPLQKRKETEKAWGSTPVVLQRPPSGRQKHNASDPTVFSLLGLLGFLVVFLLFFFSLVCVCVCPYSHFLLILLPERLPLFTDICSNLASSTHWSLSCFLALRSLRKTFAPAQILLHTNWKKPGGHSSHFALLQLSGSPPPGAGHWPIGLHWPQTRNPLFCLTNPTLGSCQFLENAFLALSSLPVWLDVTNATCSAHTCLIKWKTEQVHVHVYTFCLSLYHSTLSTSLSPGTTCLFIQDLRTKPKVVQVQIPNCGPCLSNTTLLIAQHQTIINRDAEFIFLQ